MPEPGARTAPASGAWDDIRAWRKRTRDALIAARQAMPPQLRRAQGRDARQRLAATVDFGRFEILGIYWPIRGEIDVRDLALRHLERGGRVAMPVVVERNAPVEFWQWTPRTRMTRGHWNIPVPAERRRLEPDALIVPLVGHDSRGYRLGYGGGYYDRSLASMARRPFCAGIGFSFARLDSIYPQPHDIPMDVVITEALAHAQADSDATRRMVSSASSSGADSDCAG